MILRLFLVFLAILKNWFHVIIILILLELGILLAFIALAYSISFAVRYENLFLFSTLIVIEARLRIALLARITRSHGNDYLIIF
jgi:hypothetical protein